MHAATEAESRQYDYISLSTRTTLIDRARRLLVTLARVARTCKAFSEPASRILWAVQDGLAPAVSVLKNNVSGSISVAFI